jgi:hypothetical protein
MRLDKCRDEVERPSLTCLGRRFLRVSKHCHAIPAINRLPFLNLFI